MPAEVSAAFTEEPDRGLRVPTRLLRLVSDEGLVERARGGSEAAFEAIFDRHHRGILAFCRHMLGTVDEAEDAVQQTFLAAYRQLARAGDRPRRRRPGAGGPAAPPPPAVALHDRPQPLHHRAARAPARVRRSRGRAGD